MLLSLLRRFDEHLVSRAQLSSLAGGHRVDRNVVREHRSTAWSESSNVSGPPLRLSARLKTPRQIELSQRMPILLCPHRVLYGGPKSRTFSIPRANREPKTHSRNEEAMHVRETARAISYLAAAGVIFLALPAATRDFGQWGAQPLE